MNELSNPKPINKRGRKRKGFLQFRTRTWYAVLTVDVDGEALRKRVNLETDNKAVARRKLARLVAEQSNPTSLEAVEQAAKAPETYKELADRVASSRKAEGIADVCYEQSRERKWVLPDIGHLPIVGIRPAHIAGLY